MNKCNVCGSTDYYEELVSEILIIDGQRILVENIPAKVCTNCGQPTYSRQTTEKLRRLLHSQTQPAQPTPDPDEGQTLNPALQKRLQSQQQAIAHGEQGQPFQDVILKLKLD